MFFPPLYCCLEKSMSHWFVKSSEQEDTRSTISFRLPKLLKISSKRGQSVTGWSSQWPERQIGKTMSRLLTMDSLEVDVKDIEMCQKGYFEKGMKILVCHDRML